MKGKKGRGREGTICSKGPRVEIELGKNTALVHGAHCKQLGSPINSSCFVGRLRVMRAWELSKFRHAYHSLSLLYPFSQIPGKWRGCSVAHESFMHHRVHISSSRILCLLWLMQVWSYADVGATQHRLREEWCRLFTAVEHCETSLSLPLIQFVKNVLH